MDPSIHARLAADLPQGRWTPENHRKLVDLVARRVGEPRYRPGVTPAGLALFDADHTTWSGDLGDSTLLHLLRELKLSPRLPSVLPEVLDVPAAGFGVKTPGRLFPAARAEAAFSAMLAAYRRRVAPSATAAELTAAFESAWMKPGGPLHGDAEFTAAHRLYTGTIVATYTLLETTVGCVAFDFAEPRQASSLFSPAVRAFYASDAARRGGLGDFCRPGPHGGDVLFPAILDTGPDQPALRARGKLGAYTQIAIWEALDRTPEELAAVALHIWEAPADERPSPVVFPVDAAHASSPAPLDFSTDPARFAPGASPAEGVVLGTAAMIEGTRTRPEIADLFAFLARHGIVPVVITASHVDLVRAVLDRHYRFAGLPLVGMLPRLEGGRYGAELTAPATYRTGKVDAARVAARLLTGSEDTRPVLCAGDTNTDLEMLAYSGGHRLFFDRGKRPLMDLAEHLAGHGEAETTLVQPPF